MSKQQQQDQYVAGKIMERMAACERGALAFSDDGTVGIARVAPDSLMMAIALFDGEMIVDLHFN